MGGLISYFLSFRSLPLIQEYDHQQHQLVRDHAFMVIEKNQRKYGPGF